MICLCASLSCILFVYINCPSRDKNFSSVTIFHYLTQSYLSLFAVFSHISCYTAVHSTALDEKQMKTLPFILAVISSGLAVEFLKTSTSETGDHNKSCFCRVSQEYHIQGHYYIFWARQGWVPITSPIPKSTAWTVCQSWNLQWLTKKNQNNLMPERKKVKLQQAVPKKLCASGFPVCSLFSHLECFGK